MRFRRRIEEEAETEIRTTDFTLPKERKWYERDLRYYEKNITKTRTSSAHRCGGSGRYGTQTHQAVSLLDRTVNPSFPSSMLRGWFGLVWLERGWFDLIGARLAWLGWSLVKGKPEYMHVDQ